MFWSFCSSKWTVTNCLPKDERLMDIGSNRHCVKCVQIRSFFWSVFSPNTGKYGPEKTPHLDTLHTVKSILLGSKDIYFFSINNDYVFIFGLLWHFITKCDRYYYKIPHLFYYKMQHLYYEMQQLLQNSKCASKFLISYL